MLGVEKARDVEIRADVLNDDVGRVAPAADRDVAVRQRETLDCEIERTFHDRDTRARRVRQARSLNRIEPGQIRAKRGGNAILSGGRSIGEPRAERLTLILIDAERRRAFWTEFQEVLGDLLEQTRHVRLPGTSPGTDFTRAA